MSEQAVQQQYIPLDTPLPPVSNKAVFTEEQWRVFMALADTIIPSIRSNGQQNSVTDKIVPASDLDRAVSTLAANIPGPDARRLAREYLEERPSQNPNFKIAVHRLFSEFLPQEMNNGMSLVLNALSYVLPCFFCRKAPSLSQRKAQ